MPTLNNKNEGWECPVCHIGIAPWVVTCPTCEQGQKKAAGLAFFKATTQRVLSQPRSGSVTVVSWDRYGNGTNIPITKAIGKPLTEAGFGLPDEDIPTE